ncbi:isoprenoid synthase domain-containing protein [Mycena rosella]|uniref:Isoprenoid synthase domain-containing protein n=1 Tax=Mycena rosella TaxID=1033263 RepID=A0AAD7CXY2_MYCRO|nr:isoprenoid synthase domain-containing protein [Mycena rosella]
MVQGFPKFPTTGRKSASTGATSVNLLAALAFPLLDKGGCRVACDMMNLVFLIDEHTDEAEMETAREQARIVMDALRSPHTPRPPEEWIGGEVTGQRVITFVCQESKINGGFQRRFIDTFQSYMDTVIQQADDRNSGRIREVESYFEVRRGTIGAKPAFAICEIHMNIPNAVINNLVVARGDDGHNLVAIVMHKYHMDVQQAVNWISDLHDRVVEEFLAAWEKLPTFRDPVDREIRTYVDGVANWVRENDAWSFEFGEFALVFFRAPSIEETRGVYWTGNGNTHVSRCPVANSNRCDR